MFPFDKREIRKMFDWMDQLGSGNEFALRPVSQTQTGNACPTCPPADQLVQSSSGAGALMPFEDGGAGGLLTQLHAPRIDVDVVETDKKFQIIANVPGIEKDKVKVRLEDDNTLILQAEDTKEKNEDVGKFHRRERSYGSVTRTLRLPKDCDVQKIGCKFENGVLKIEVPKTEKKKADKSGQNIPIS